MVGMEINNFVLSCCGRLLKIVCLNVDICVLLINIGLVVLIEKGFSVIGIDLILKLVQVFKGFFYYYFKSKNDFGLVLIDVYDSYFQVKLKCYLINSVIIFFERIVLFVNDVK